MVSEAAHARTRACRAPAGRVLAGSSFSPRPCVTSRCFYSKGQSHKSTSPEAQILLPGGSLRHDHIISRSSPLPRREVANQTHTSHNSLSHQCAPMSLKIYGRESLCQHIRWLQVSCYLVELGKITLMHQKHYLLCTKTISEFFPVVKVPPVHQT